jgi:predicted metal-dependent hydrolase
MFKTSNLKLGSISVQFIRKPVQHVHLSVYPPKGKVSLIAPFSTRTEVARAYAISKLSWIKKQRIKFEKQARETPRKFIKGESYYLWGKRYILQIYYTNKKPYVQLSHKYIDLFIKKKSTT